jgi:hypothetical protein
VLSPRASRRESRSVDRVAIRIGQYDTICGFNLVNSVPTSDLN